MKMDSIECCTASYIRPETPKHCGEYPAWKRRCLAWQQAKQRGRRHQHLSGENWWSRTCTDRTDRRRPLQVQRLHNRGDGCGGKAWRGERSPGVSCGKWEQATSASLEELYIDDVLPSPNTLHQWDGEDPTSSSNSHRV